jgi:hypothetical protein
LPLIAETFHGDVVGTSDGHTLRLCNCTSPIPFTAVFDPESSKNTPLLAAEGFMIQKIQIQGEIKQRLSYVRAVNLTCWGCLPDQSGVVSCLSGGGYLTGWGNLTAWGRKAIGQPALT